MYTLYLAHSRMSCRLTFAARGPKQELQLNGCFYRFRSIDPERPPSRAPKASLRLRNNTRSWTTLGAPSHLEVSKHQGFFGWFWVATINPAFQDATSCVLRRPSGTEDAIQQLSFKSAAKAAAAAVASVAAHNSVIRCVANQDTSTPINSMELAYLNTHLGG